MSVKICKFLSAKKTQVSTLELRIAQNFNGTKYLYKISSMNCRLLRIGLILRRKRDFVVCQ